MASSVMNERLREYIKAEKSILEGGQSYRIGNRTLTRADLASVRAEIARLVGAGATIDEVPNKNRRTKRIILHD